MRLSELKTGESATILKVTGHGGFRRRIMEMGFVRGQRVEVILNAPLKDPIEYKIMGYDISLRRSEADMVVVLSDSEASEYLAGGERPLKALGIDSDCHACRGEIVVVGAYEIVSAVYEGEAVAVAAFLAGVVTGHYDKGVVAVSGSAAHA